MNLKEGEVKRQTNEELMPIDELEEAYIEEENEYREDVRRQKIRKKRPYEREGKVFSKRPKGFFNRKER